jgi:high-affinity iron transporter
MLNSVIIILREVLEAALIISVLLASSKSLVHVGQWLLTGLGCGVVGSVAIAVNMTVISEAVEGTGQELLNSALLIAIILAIGGYLYAIYRHQDALQPSPTATKKAGITLHRFTLISMVVIVALTSMREGSEIIIYLKVYFTNLAINASILMGASIGLGIGLSIGALFYFCLAYLSTEKRRWISVIILMLVASGLASEATLGLIQAGYLPSQVPLWDTSNILPERSVLGQLLYALVAYEATPTLLQVDMYVTTFFALLVLIGVAVDDSH